MMKLKKGIIYLVLTGIFLFSSISNAQKAKHTFKLGTTEFILDDEPYQIISGEMHPARIPAEYWKHRIQMAKAMGCNTISAYIFWNYHESEEGVFDFTTVNRNLSQFMKLVQDEEMWLGFLEEYPDYWTQAETEDELKENLVDLYKELTSGTISNVRRVAELKVS